MNGPLYKFFVDDHRRLEKLLNRAAANAPEYDMTAYGQFRSGLLKHIKMEENIIIPAAQKAREGKPLPIAEKVRLDHGAIVALMVPPPAPNIVKALRQILANHNRLEEDLGGLYDLCERLSGPRLEEIMNMVGSVTDVPVLPHRSGPDILQVTRRALERAGYKLDDNS